MMYVVASLCAHVRSLSTVKNGTKMVNVWASRRTVSICFALGKAVLRPRIKSVNLEKRFSRNLELAGI